VVLLGVTTIAFDQPWLLVPLAYGFLARVFAGPTFNPLGQLVTRVLTPRLGLAPRWVPGPPKRFAQGIGATLTATAAVLHFGFGATAAAYVLVGMVVVAASLESLLGFCLGCVIFRGLMRVGVIPEEACEQCSDLWGKRPVTPA
jgi:hypothetical protein